MPDLDEWERDRTSWRDAGQRERMLGKHLICPECQAIITRRDRFSNHHPDIAKELPNHVLGDEACEPCGWIRIARFKRTCQKCSIVFYAYSGDVSQSICSECIPFSEDVERQRIKPHNGAARKHGRQGTLTIEQWLQTIRDFDYKCAYCQEKRFDTLDHFIPFRYGGDTSSLNCVPACHSCNASKGPYHPDSRAGGVQHDKLERVRTYLAEKK